MKSFPLKKILRLKKLLGFYSMSFLAVSAFALAPPPQSPFWTVQDGKLLDPNGNPFIFRGVTIEQNLAPEKALQAIKDAAALGANAVQVEINGNSYSPQGIIAGHQLSAIINTCKESKVVCVLEPNDVAGYPDAAGSGIPATASIFWSWPGIREAIDGQQPYIILGFGNQYLAPMPQYQYIARMQSYLANFSGGPLSKFIIMIDGSGWGQDANNAMYEFARQFPQVGTNRPHLIYSVEMFDAYTSPDSVRDYIARFAEIKAPLVIGGFAPVPYYHPHNIAPVPHVALPLPAEAVMQYAEEFGVGYFGWSWSGNENPNLDIVNNWNPDELSAWGDQLINGTNGIKATAKIASIYEGDTSSSSSNNSSSSAAANQPPVAVIKAFISPGQCGRGRILASAENSYDPDGDALTYSWRLNGTSAVNENSMEVEYKIVSYVEYRLTLTVTDSKGLSSTSVQYMGTSYFDYCPPTSSSSSSSSSVPPSSSSSSLPSSSSTASSSSVPSIANCSYVINSQWNNGFTAVIRIKNTGSQTIQGWDVNWQYTDGSKITNLWNANWTGTNPYNAKNLNWNSTIQPGQTIEFGFQGSKSAGAASIPIISGAVCQ